MQTHSPLCIYHGLNCGLRPLPSEAILCQKYQTIV